MISRCAFNIVFSCALLLLASGGGIGAERVVSCSQCDDPGCSCYSDAQGNSVLLLEEQDVESFTCKYINGGCDCGTALNCLCGNTNGNCECNATRDSCVCANSNGDCACAAVEKCECRNSNGDCLCSETTSCECANTNGICSISTGQQLAIALPIVFGFLCLGGCVVAACVYSARRRSGGSDRAAAEVVVVPAKTQAVQGQEEEVVESPAAPAGYYAQPEPSAPPRADDALVAFIS